MPAFLFSPIFVRSRAGWLALLLGGWVAVAAEPAVTFRAGEPAHVVAAPETALERLVVRQLGDYLGRVLGAPVRVVPDLAGVPAGAPAVILLRADAAASLDLEPPTGSPEAFALETRKWNGRSVVLAAGREDRGLKRAVQRLVMRGEQSEEGLRVPAMKFREKPWIPRREWTLCAWSPEMVRGLFHNPHADKRMNVWLYSDRQIAAYVDMFDWFGFSGSQLMETVANYAAVGSAEAYRGRLRQFARSLRANGQDVTLWVWAAQFNDFGWFDREVPAAPAAGHTAFNDPQMRAAFERYYDGYAEIAPEVDLLIAHFYDPGVLKDRADVFAYMGLLRDKFRARNPRVRLGVDFWYAGEEAGYMRELVQHGFQDVLFLENTMPHTYPPGRREALHEAARANGLQLGVWGWHTAEMESDQLPTMHVNTQLLSRFYRQIRDGADRIHPLTYWSEMEACHLVNIYSLYAAGQLLWNPDRDPGELRREIADAIWGPRTGPRMAEVLEFIEDVRSGPTWDTYWWSQPEHRLGTADPASDLRRADAALALVEGIRPDPSFVPKLPLPFGPAELAELIVPHLRQIRAYAEFRVRFAEVKAAAPALPSEELARRLQAVWDPIRDYSTWVGAFGPPEARAQENAVVAFAAEHGLTLAPPAWMLWRDADRLLQSLQAKQRAQRGPFLIEASATYLHRDFYWSPEKGRARFALLVEKGLLVPVRDGVYRLANWEEHQAR